MTLTFADIANLLYPYCGGGMTNADFVIELIDSFMEEPDDGDISGDYNPLRGLVSRTLENFYNGSRPIGQKNASKILRHTDKERFESFIESSSGDALEAIAKALVDKGVEATALNASAVCADLMENAIHLCSTGNKVANKNTATEVETTEPTPDQSNSRFKPLKIITPPDEVAEYELSYISKLMAAYGEAEGIIGFSKETMNQYSKKYGEHYKRQRKDFYAAESVRQGTRETYGDTDPDQFEVLKEETFDGVIEVWEQEHRNGYIRLNAVLAQSALVRIDRCWLCRDTDWIGNSQKKGICHILANDGTIKRWVNSDE